MSEIYSRLVDHTITNTNEINDFSVGSAMRALYEAVAIELEQFYVLTRENIMEAIEQGVYESFNFKRKEATKAYGTVQIAFHNTTQSDIVVPRGTRFSSSNPLYNQIYETLIDYYIPKGSILAEFQVYCTTLGSVGNIPAQAIDTMQTPIANLSSVGNQQAIQTGQDEEPIEETRARFASYITSLSRATVPAIEYGVRSVQNVSGVYIEEETGRINIYAHDRNGNLPENVQTDILNILYYYKPAGIPVRLLPVTREAINVDVTVTLSNKSGITSAFQNQIAQTITNYLNNMTTGQSLILSDLSSAIKYIDRQMIYDVQFNNLKSNVVLKGSEIIRAGNVTVNLQ